MIIGSAQGFGRDLLELSFLPRFKQVPWDTRSSPGARCGVSGDGERGRPREVRSTQPGRMAARTALLLALEGTRR